LCVTALGIQFVKLIFQIYSNSQSLRGNCTTSSLPRLIYFFLQLNKNVSLRLLEKEPRQAVVQNPSSPCGCTTPNISLLGSRICTLLVTQNNVPTESFSQPHRQNRIGIANQNPNLKMRLIPSTLVIDGIYIQVAFPINECRHPAPIVSRRLEAIELLGLPQPTLTHALYPLAHG